MEAEFQAFAKAKSRPAFDRDQPPGVDRLRRSLTPAEVRKEEERPGWTECHNHVIFCDGGTALSHAAGLAERVRDLR